jgi:hypothetical protein
MTFETADRYGSTARVWADFLEGRRLVRRRFPGAKQFRFWRDRNGRLQALPTDDWPEGTREARNRRLEEIRRSL